MTGLPARDCETRRMAANDNDGFLGCDVAAPNAAAQRRGHKLVIVFMLVAGVVALIAGLSEGVQDIAASFPTWRSLFELAAWGRFFGALGEIATVGVIVIAVALIWRWAIRRRRA